MADRNSGKLAFEAKMLLVVLGSMALALPIAARQGNTVPKTQTPAGDASAVQVPSMPRWQINAGGKKSFDVASVKLDTGAFTPPLFPLDSSDAYRPTGGRFKAAFSLPVYIQFAYKFRFTQEQAQTAQTHLPKWVSSDRFLIEARVEGNPTKDQMRLMMQSLLADRFKLAIHFESPEVPVFALALIKPGKMGPNLRLHANGPVCEPPPANGRPAMDGPVFPPICDAYMMTALPTGRKLGSRNTTMALLAESLAGPARLGRPVVDRTGIADKVDFTLEWVPEPETAASPDAVPPPDVPGTTFLQAVREQLGLKLEATKAAVPILVVDRVERPSEN
jgi:bla regulator protein blaR1